MSEDPTLEKVVRRFDDALIARAAADFHALEAELDRAQREDERAQRRLDELTRKYIKGEGFGPQGMPAPPPTRCRGYQSIKD